MTRTETGRTRGVAGGTDPLSWRSMVGDNLIDSIGLVMDWWASGSGPCWM